MTTRPADAPALALAPLATMTLQLCAPLVIADTPAGTRWIVEAHSGRIDGDTVHAAIIGNANADWFVIGPDRIGTVDARLTAHTDDGALVLVQYHGRVDLAAEPLTIFIAPRFDCGDRRYRWLNVTQAVGKGTFTDATTLVYDLFVCRGS